MYFTKTLTTAFLLMTCLATASPLVLERSALDVKELDVMKRSPCQFLKRDGTENEDGVDFASCGN
ncbi:hypothetical protein SCHPADRAFT_900195 [Schizopora paradoxa]|uniref:Uncharacterized protein n=1 Tax=Schizopora paradoxa TaxID=27342 RepID=A0A0H2S1D3_9AGAM|nr:hypothetical protein SCHPADRAFT_900195 [Schizopora paradoxa]